MIRKIKIIISIAMFPFVILGAIIGVRFFGQRQSTFDVLSASALKAETYENETKNNLHKVETDSLKNPNRNNSLDDTAFLKHSKKISYEVTIKNTESDKDLYASFTLPSQEGVSVLINGEKISETKTLIKADDTLTTTFTIITDDKTETKENFDLDTKLVISLEKTDKNFEKQTKTSEKEENLLESRKVKGQKISEKSTRLEKSNLENKKKQEERNQAKSKFESNNQKLDTKKSSRQEINNQNVNEKSNIQEINNQNVNEKSNNENQAKSNIADKKIGNRVMPSRNKKTPKNTTDLGSPNQEISNQELLNKKSKTQNLKSNNPKSRTQSAKRQNLNEQKLNKANENNQISSNQHQSEKKNTSNQVQKIDKTDKFDYNKQPQTNNHKQ